jgi:hypothetical protein
MRRFRGMTRLAIPVVGAALLFAGCGSSELTASSLCKDFMAASPEAQAQAISKLSSQFDTPEVATPLGSPSVAYTCSSDSAMSLADLFQRYHEGEG